MRALVDSPALVASSGTNPALVSVSVWGASTFIAGLVGVLIAPIVGLQASSFALLLRASLTAVLVAGLTHFRPGDPRRVQLGHRLVTTSKLSTTNRCSIVGDYCCCSIRVHARISCSRWPGGGTLRKALLRADYWIRPLQCRNEAAEVTAMRSTAHSKQRHMWIDLVD